MLSTPSSARCIGQPFGDKLPSVMSGLQPILGNVSCLQVSFLITFLWVIGLCIYSWMLHMKR